MIFLLSILHCLIIKEKLTDFISHFYRDGSFYLACHEKTPFFTSEQPKRYSLWSCERVYDAFHYLLYNIFIWSGSKLYEPVHEISNNLVCATNKASDQSAHTRSLIRAFASRLSIL